MLLGGIAAWVWGVPRLYRAFSEPFQFGPIPGLDGFRIVNSGSVSGATDIALLAVDRVSDAQRDLRADLRGNPCSIFGSARNSGKLPLAVFTDYYCPYCPEMSDLVIELSEGAAPIAPVWWDLPLLGPRSEYAARVAIAAGNQGQYLPVHKHLMHKPLRPGPVALNELAARFDLNGEDLRRDMQAPETDLNLETAHAARAVFAMIGTPSIVVGRSVLIGRTSKQSFLDLIELEYNSSEFRDSCGRNGSL